MLTVRSILTGALVLGAVSVPAGVVVTDFASDSVPAAPRTVVVEAPDFAATAETFEDVFVSEVPLPPRPDRIVGVEEPRVETPGFDLEDAVLRSVSVAPPAEIDIRRI
ncbi:MAG: hypothetical protein ACWGON_09885 [Gemmatimonadota bacterium]